MHFLFNLTLTLTLTLTLQMYFQIAQSTKAIYYHGGQYGIGINLMRCTNIKNSVLLLFSCIMIVSGCGGGNGSDSSNNPAINVPNSSSQSLQEIVDEATSGSIDGLFVYISQPGVQDQPAVSGIQNRATGDQATSDSLFKIASLSKLFIAVAATKLVNQNSLQMDDTLAMWLPSMSGRIENAEQITIRQMLRHRSGIPDFDSQTGFSWQNPHTSLDATLQYALDLPADFAPDAKYEYSNTNYLLIGQILDTVLGFSHHQFIRDEILIPLQMNNTFLLLEEVDTSRLVHGYWNGVDRIMQDYAIPGGSMISTTRDVAVFIRALNTDGLLTAQEKQIYPYFYGHTGWVPGYQSFAEYHQDQDTVIILFVNTTGGGSESQASTTLAKITRYLNI